MIETFRSRTDVYKITILVKCKKPFRTHFSAQNAWFSKRMISNSTDQLTLSGVRSAGGGGRGLPGHDLSLLAVRTTGLGNLLNKQRLVSVDELNHVSPIVPAILLKGQCWFSSGFWSSWSWCDGGFTQRVPNTPIAVERRFETFVIVPRCKGLADYHCSQFPPKVVIGPRNALCAIENLATASSDRSVEFL